MTTGTQRVDAHQPPGGMLAVKRCFGVTRIAVDHCCITLRVAHRAHPVGAIVVLRKVVVGQLDRRPAFFAMTPGTISCGSLVDRRRRVTVAADIFETALILCGMTFGTV